MKCQVYLGDGGLNESHSLTRCQNDAAEGRMFCVQHIAQFERAFLDVLDRDRLLWALGYAAGALLRTQLPSPSQRADDERMAQVCLDLAREVMGQDG